MLLGLGVLGLLVMRRPAPPTGQVLATIDGREVTVQDIKAESRASGVPDFAGTRDALLDRVISRRLLAASAKREQLDRMPTAPSDLARVEQGWLAQLALRRALPPASVPDPVTLAGVRASNPFSFGQRAIYTLDTLTVYGGGDLVAPLRSYTDLDLAEAFADRLGAKTVRRPQTVDSGRIPSGVAQSLASLPEGAIQVRDEPGRLSLTRIQSRAAVTLPPGDQELLAQQIWASETTSAQIRTEVARLKAASRIVYAAGSHPLLPTEREAAAVPAPSPLVSGAAPF